MNTSAKHRESWSLPGRAIRAIAGLALGLGLPAAPAAGQAALQGTPEELRAHFEAMRVDAVLRGEGEVKVPADRAVVAVSVTTEDNELAGALAENAQVRQKVRAALRPAGITDDRVVAERFVSTPRTGKFTGRVRSYEVSNRLLITVTDERQLQALARVVDNEKEVELGSVRYEHSADATHQLEAARRAIEKVKTRRAVFEQGFGVTLRLVRFEEHSGGMVPQPAGRAVAAASLPKVKTASSSLRHAEAADFLSAGQAFGEMVYRTTVTASYQIDDVRPAAAVGAP